MKNPIERYRQIRLVALDLDGTLLHSDMSLSRESRQAIARVQRLGIEVVIASGRPYHSLPDVMLQLPDLHYAITSNGAAIHTLPDGERYYGVCLSPDAVLQILSVTEHRPVLFETFIRGVAYTEACYFKDPVQWGNPHPAYIWKTRKPVCDMRAFIRENRKNLDGIAIVCMQQEEKNRLQNQLQETVQNVDITTSCSQLLEIADGQAGKATALQRLCQKMNLSLNQCAAFGNAENDSQMLCDAGLGIAVANASPVCLRCADLVTQSNDKDGVAKILLEIAAARECAKL